MLIHHSGQPWCMRLLIGFHNRTQPFQNEVVIKADKSWGNVPFVNVIDILQLRLIIIFCFKIRLTLNHCKQKITVQSVKTINLFKISTNLHTVPNRTISFPNLIYSMSKLMSVCPEDGSRKRMFDNVPEPYHSVEDVPRISLLVWFVSRSSGSTLKASKVWSLIPQCKRVKKPNKFILFQINYISKAIVFMSSWALGLDMVIIQLVNKVVVESLSLETLNSGLNYLAS